MVKPLCSNFSVVQIFRNFTVVLSRGEVKAEDLPGKPAGHHKQNVAISHALPVGLETAWTQF